MEKFLCWGGGTPACRQTDEILHNSALAECLSAKLTIVNDVRTVFKQMNQYVYVPDLT